MQFQLHLRRFESLGNGILYLKEKYALNLTDDLMYADSNRFGLHFFEQNQSMRFRQLCDLLCIKVKW